jgi:ATP-dependent NAD(P)H-hydrate dehydratase
MQSFAKLAIQIARESGTYLVIDADGLFLVGRDPSIIKGYRRAVLTPNVVEFKRLGEQIGVNPTAPAHERAGLISKLLGGVTVLEKGRNDLIAVDTTGNEANLKASHLSDLDEAKENTAETIEVDVEGGFKRCGGQGDVLSGAVGTFLAWGRCYEDGAFGYVTARLDKSQADQCLETGAYRPPEYHSLPRSEGAWSQEKRATVVS